jgi:hypothetical protein
MSCPASISDALLLRIFHTDDYKGKWLATQWIQEVLSRDYNMQVNQITREMRKNFAPTGWVDGKSPVTTDKDGNTLAVFYKKHFVKAANTHVHFYYIDTSLEDPIPGVKFDELIKDGIDGAINILNEDGGVGDGEIQGIADSSSNNIERVPTNPTSRATS